MPTAPQREARINRIARKLAIRFRRKRSNSGKARIFRRKDRKRFMVRNMIAYDFETTRIQAGTPQPLYITAYGNDGSFQVSKPVSDSYDVLDVLNEHFLLDALNKSRFVAWNGNNFDVYFIAAALLHNKDYTLRPYLTRSKSLRGLKVIPNDPVLGKTHYWEFLDGISMLGMVGTPLKDFLNKFAPDYQKLDAPDFEARDFDPQNPQDVAYAERDSEGLYYGMLAAETIVVDNFRIGLSGTIGNMGIKIFQDHIPESVFIKEPPIVLHAILKEYVMRGGFCYSTRKYSGPVWKYDLNQAYAAAMRDASLPTGQVFYSPKGINKYASVFVVRVSGHSDKTGNIIPFYYRRISDDKTDYAKTDISDTWITSIEYRQLVSEGWSLDVKESYYWAESFDMREYVRKLEHLRMNVSGGPSGPSGTMIKAIGNNSYGKTVEMLDGLELVMANERPDGYAEYYIVDDSGELVEHLSHIWFKFGEAKARDYHQPQLGCFITAHVRMVVRRAALLNPSAFLYADTDCACFSESVPLECDTKKYGMWKIESEGDWHYFITKKVYARADGKDIHAKGLNRKRLTIDDIIGWFNGQPPIQTQTQKNNFVKVMSGKDMFRTTTKTGQKIVAKPTVTM